MINKHLIKCNIGDVIRCIMARIIAAYSQYNTVFRALYFEAMDFAADRKYAMAYVANIICTKMRHYDLLLLQQLFNAFKANKNISENDVQACLQMRQTLEHVCAPYHPLSLLYFLFPFNIYRLRPHSTCIKHYRFGT